MEIVAARADRLRDPGAKPVDETGDLLQPGAGRRYTTDVAAADDIGEGKRDAIDDRRTAIRPHDNEIALIRVPLECDLIIQADVVAEQHDVEPEAQRLERLGGRIFPGCRDE